MSVTLDGMSVQELDVLIRRAQATRKQAQEREDEQSFTKGLKLGEIKQIDGVWYGRGQRNSGLGYVMFKVEGGALSFSYGMIPDFYVRYHRTWLEDGQSFTDDSILAIVNPENTLLIARLLLAERGQ